jgi:hypothetical protein
MQDADMTTDDTSTHPKHLQKLSYLEAHELFRDITREQLEVFHVPSHLIGVTLSRDAFYVVCNAPSMSPEGAIRALSR